MISARPHVHPPMPAGARRTARWSGKTWASLAATVVIGTGLTACDKPQPSISVFTGSTAKKVSAQPACLYIGQCSIDNGRVVDLTAAPGSTILVDVPRALARAGWIVNAYTQDSAGKNTPIAGAGSSGSNHHTARVAVPSATGSYVLQIVPLAPSKGAVNDRVATVWLVRVQLGQ